MLEESIRRIDAFRAAHPEHPIVDVQYDDLVRDPVGTVESIYAAFGRLDARSPTTRGGDAPRTSPRTRRTASGVHGYDLAEFGLDAAQLAERVRRLRRPLRRADRATVR